MHALTARDLMTTEVLTVRDTSPLPDLAAFLIEHQITGAPVEDADGMVVGVVSVVDIAKAEAAKGQTTAWFYLGTGPMSWDRSDKEARLVDLREDVKTVRDLMSPTLHTVSPVDTVAEIAKTLLDHHLHRVLVVENGRLVGLISNTDLLQLFVDDESLGYRELPEEEEEAAAASTM